MKNSANLNKEGLMKKLATLLGVLALTALVWAQGTTGISGTVTSAATGLPIAGAFVATWHDFGRPDSNHMPPPGGGGNNPPPPGDSGRGPGGHHGPPPPPGDSGRGPRGHHGPPPGALTDSTGYYEMTDLHPGKYIVCAQALGFEPAMYADTVTVDSGEIATGINFALQLDTMLGVISGHVTDAITQQPIAGAFVCAFQRLQPDSCHRPPQPDSGIMPPPPRGDSGHGRGGRRGPPPNGDSTDVNGYYEIKYLRPGNYIVSARAAGYASAIYAETVVVVHGQTTANIDFALRPARTTSRTGGRSSAASVGLTSSSGMDSGFYMVPNPCHGQSTILYTLPEAGTISLRVYNASGRLVSDVAQGYFEAGDYAASIAVGHVARGIYIVRLRTASDELAQKLIVR
jgi:hypothetical protein